MLSATLTRVFSQIQYQLLWWPSLSAFEHTPGGHGSQHCKLAFPQGTYLCEKHTLQKQRARKPTANPVYNLKHKIKTRPGGQILAWWMEHVPKGVCECVSIFKIPIALRNILSCLPSF